MLNRILLFLFVSGLLLSISCGDDEPEDILFPPIPAFTADKQEILMGDSIAFTDISENVPIEYRWRFEGGSPETSSIANPKVRYNSKGTFDVVMEVENGDGLDSLVQEDFITVCERTFTLTDEDTTTSGIYVYEDATRLVKLLFGDSVINQFDSEGRLADIQFYEAGVMIRNQSLSYDDQGRVERVNQEEIGDQRRLTEYSYSTNNDGNTIVSTTEFEETSVGSQQLELTGDSTAFLMVDGNVSSFTSYTTDIDGLKQVDRVGTITYSAEEWRLDHAIFFDLLDYPLITNRNIFSEVNVTDEAGTTTFFTGEVTITGTGEDISSVQFTEEATGETPETTTLALGKDCN